MTRRWPLWPTIIVALAIIAMLALGVWQLQRRGEKQSLIALYAANVGKSIALPETPPIPDAALFRTASAICLEVVGWQVEGGRGRSGATGYRHIAQCRTGAEGPGLLVDLGVSKDFKAVPDWKGGPVTGTIAAEPQHISVVSRLFGTAPPPRPLLIASRPAAGLEPTQAPRPEDIPNNHLAYAAQWFIFAGVAALIYWLALRRRWLAGVKREG